MFVVSAAMFFVCARFKSILSDTLIFLFHLLFNHGEFSSRVQPSARIGMQIEDRKQCVKSDRRSSPPATCKACAALAGHMQHSNKNYQDTTHAKLVGGGVGRIFVNQFGCPAEDTDDLVEIQPEGHFLPHYACAGMMYFAS